MLTLQKCRYIHLTGSGTMAHPSTGWRPNLELSQVSSPPTLTSPWGFGCTFIIWLPGIKKLGRLLPAAFADCLLQNGLHCAKMNRGAVSFFVGCGVVLDCTLDTFRRRYGSFLGWRWWACSTHSAGPSSSFWHDGLVPTSPPPCISTLRFIMQYTAQLIPQPGLNNRYHPSHSPLECRGGLSFLRIGTRFVLEGYIQKLIQTDWRFLVHK